MKAIAVAQSRREVKLVDPPEPNPTLNAGRDASERWPAPLRSLVTRRYPLEGHADVLLGRHGGIKNVFSLDGRP